MKKLKNINMEKIKTLVGWDSTRFSAEKEYANPELITLQVFSYTDAQPEWRAAFNRLEKCLKKTGKMDAFKHLGYYMLPLTPEEKLPYQNEQMLENLVLFMIQNNYAQKEEMHLFLFMKSIDTLKENQQILQAVQHKLFEKGYFVNKDKFQNLAIRESMGDLPDDVEDQTLMLMQQKIIEQVVQPVLSLQRPYESKRTLTERLERISLTPSALKRKI